MVKGAGKEPSRVASSLRCAIGAVHFPMRIKERKLDCLSQEKLHQAHCFVRCLGWEGGQEGSNTCMPKVVESALDVKLEEKRVLVRDVGQGNHVVGSEEGLNGLATWDCPNLDMEGWPVGMEAAHQNAREELLQNFKEKDGTNLGCSGGIRSFWQQARNACEKGRRDVSMNEHGIQQGEKQALPAGGVSQRHEEFIGHATWP